MLFLLACDDGSAGGIDTALDCTEPAWPVLAFSEERVDFGYVPAGESGTASIAIQNVGVFPLGLTSIDLGDQEIPDFSLEIQAVDCASWVDVAEAGDSGGADSWSPPDPDTAPPVDVSALVLEPGCVVPLTVTYTPTISGGAENAVVARSERGTGFLEDPFHRARGVWLAGSTDLTEIPDPVPYIVGDYIAVDPTAVHEGEQVAMEVRVRSERVTYHWTVAEGGGTFDRADVSTPTYTAPEIPGCSPSSGKNDGVYAVVTDADGGQDWAFARVAVWDARTPLASCADRVLECPEDEEEGEEREESLECGVCGCGCGPAEGSALSAVPLGLGLLTLVRVRRRQRS